MITTAGGIPVLPGDFAAVHTAGPVGRLIHLGEILNGDGFGDWEHAVFFAGGDEDLIIEAEPGGAVMRPMHYSPLEVLWSSGIPALALTKVQRLGAMDAAKKYVGVPYSWLDYFALAAHRLHIPAPGLKAYIESTRSMICSQLADRLRLDLGSHLFSDGRWPGYVTPLSLADLISQKAP